MMQELPKQFLTIGEKPMLLITLERFAQALPEADFTVVLPHEHIGLWQNLVKHFNCAIEHQMIAGGATRFESVKRGLALISGGITAIHDGVRPFPSDELIKRCFRHATQHESAIPAIPLTDTIRKVHEGVSTLVDRQYLRSVQTPQCFDTEKIKAAYMQVSDTGFTDCASVWEAAGLRPQLVEGERENIKITVPADLPFASWLFEQQNQRKL
ncbi:MAG: 2-C-methyl-D-erythritol 4-phosphate cytidylyltransferase [Bacteroidia bacterium]|nr:2-C-methyl-D-erythritol 4-phosphate cytidylyltransferase [Bacteroidia bacterium]